jgi:hypothetical protein
MKIAVDVGFEFSIGYSGSGVQWYSDKLMAKLT